MLKLIHHFLMTLSPAWLNDILAYILCVKNFSRYAKMLFVCAHAPHFFLLFVIASWLKLLKLMASDSWGKENEVLIKSLEFYFLVKVAFNLYLLICIFKCPKKFQMQNITADVRNKSLALDWTVLKIVSVLHSALLLQ